MDRPGVEILLIGAAVSVIILAISIYLGNVILHFFKVQIPPRGKQATPNFNSTRLENEKMRKTIISRSIHPTSEPEDPLS